MLSLAQQMDGAGGSQAAVRRLPGGCILRRLPATCRRQEAATWLRAPPAR